MKPCFIITAFVVCSFNSIAQRPLSDSGRAELDTNQQYYILKEKFERGDKQKNLVLKLLPLAISHNDLATAREAHNDFFNFVKDPFRKDTLNMICSSISKSSDRGFQFVLNNASKINSIIGDKQQALTVIKGVMVKEIYNDYLKGKNYDSMNWNQIAKVLKRKSALFQDNLLLTLKIFNAAWNKRWEDWSSFQLDYYDKYSSSFSHDEKFVMNNTLWDLFQKSNKKETLLRASKWSKFTIEMYEPGKEDFVCIDTYANLLYKIGNIDQAIVIEEHAIKLAASDDTYKKELSENLRKMKGGLPTW